MYCSRRSLAAIVGSILLAYEAKVLSQPKNNDEPYSDKEAADEWMMQWMQSPKATSGGLYVGKFADRVYFLTKEVLWEPNPGQRVQRMVRAPAGFVTDFASIPRLFWTLLPPDGAYAFAAIIHDYLYWYQPVARDEADLVLKYAMEDFKIGPVTIQAIYAAVRAGGGSAWRSNAALKAAGERRILKIYPPDAKIRWTEWKARADVF